MFAVTGAMGYDGAQDLDSLFAGNKPQQLHTQRNKLLPQIVDRIDRHGSHAGQFKVLPFEHCTQQGFSIIEMTVDSALGHTGTSCYAFDGEMHVAFGKAVEYCIKDTVQLLHVHRPPGAGRLHVFITHRVISLQGVEKAIMTRAIHRKNNVQTPFTERLRSVTIRHTHICLKGCPGMRALLLSILSITLLSGCAEEQDSEKMMPVVKVQTAEIDNAQEQHWTLSGTVQSRRDAALSFLISGQISERLAQAGERVKAGQVLLRLDPRDIRQQLAAAQANVAAARAQAENAEANRDRLASLSKQGLVPAQAYEDARAQARAARQSAKAAEAALAQATSTNEYGELKAPADGVLLEVSGEVGQVVTAGMPVATLAYDGPRDIEVFVPERRRTALPEQARVELYGGQVAAPASLREVAGSADPMSRSWRTRYSIEDEPGAWPLGSSATLILPASTNAEASALQAVPVGALIDRGDGMGVWVIEDARVNWQPVELERMDTERAYIRTDLAPGTRIIALGAHLLEPNQKVEALP